MSRVTKLLLAGVVGVSAAVIFYLSLFVVQIANADMACESYPHTVPGADYLDVRGICSENSFLNLGGRCTYRMGEGSVVVTREPGWFSETIAGFAAVFAVAVAYLARQKGHPGWLYGLTTLFAPPLGLALTLAAPRGARSGAAS